MVLLIYVLFNKAYVYTHNILLSFLDIRHNIALC